jgi:hypothetical protein
MGKVVADHTATTIGKSTGYVKKNNSVPGMNPPTRYENMQHNKPYNTQTQSDISIKIERLVRAIERCDSPAFTISHSAAIEVQIHRTKLSRHFDRIEQMVALFAFGDDYHYSEHLQVFRDACCGIGLEHSPIGITCLNETGTRYLSTSETLNVLVERIRHLTRQRRYLRKKHDRPYQARLQERKITDYADRILDRYARTVVVRVDLYYREAAQARLRIEQVFKDLDGLIKARDRNELFDHETGYICSIEQGESRGYHIHAAFFFNGAHVRGDIYKAQRIGELWEQLTRGRGCFNNCNRNKDIYGERCALGVVRRDDSNVRRHLRHAISYLAKDDQRLRLRPRGGRALRKGQCIGT